MITLIRVNSFLRVVNFLNHLKFYCLNHLTIIGYLELYFFHIFTYEIVVYFLLYFFHNSSIGTYLFFFLFKKK